MADAAARFAAALRARGIEITLRNNQLRVWPGRAYKHGLTDAEREFIREHRDELKALVRGGLPETTVLWDGTVPAPPVPVATANQDEPDSHRCPYCGRPCVGVGHWAYRTLHNDHDSPARIASTTKEMLLMLGR